VSGPTSQFEKAVLNTPAKRGQHAATEALIATPELMQKWQKWKRQRPVRITEKVMEAAEFYKQNGGIIEQSFTLGVVKGVEYILDGQHRREAAYISKLPEFYIEVKRVFFDDPDDMGALFDRLNSRLASYKSDDALRALEADIPGIAKLREVAPFVGYDQLRRNPHSPILSMSTVLKAWLVKEVPSSSLGMATKKAAQGFTVEEAVECGRFLNLCMDAWGRDTEYRRLWAQLNLGLTSWLYQRTVLRPIFGEQRDRLTREQFKKGLSALSTDSRYLEWVVNRRMDEHSRSPAYNKITALFSARLREEFKRAPKLPRPEWVHSGGYEARFARERMDEARANGTP